jgi:hypothetical protein
MAESTLPPPVPAEYGGKWIVWTRDGMRIARVGDTRSEARAVAESAVTTETIYEWVPPADARLIGGRR